jgi:hypothetical protein
MDCFAWFAMTDGKRYALLNIVSSSFQGARSASRDVQLHIGEIHTSDCDYGFRACAKRRIPE